MHSFLKAYTRGIALSHDDRGTSSLEYGTMVAIFAIVLLAAVSSIVPRAQNLASDVSSDFTNQGGGTEGSMEPAAVAPEATPTSHQTGAQSNPAGDNAPNR